MTTQHHATIGSISEATLRTEDLISAFAWEFDHLTEGRQTEQQNALSNAAALWLASTNKDDDEAMDTGGGILEDLSLALEELAPAYCYFGTIEGDGACFGFWPCMEQIEELPRVKDSDEAKALGEECLFVNDHGNVTVFGGDGSIILDIV